MNQSGRTIANRNRRSENQARGRTRTGWRVPGLALLAPLAVLSAACGGSSSTSPTPVAVPTPTPPAAAVTATGNGVLVLHPSLNPTFGVAMETPIRVRETGGGTADWNFARLSFFKSGREIERVEAGADTIAAAGAARINPNSDKTYNLLFRFNSSDFDDIQITLGFADAVTGRQITATVSLSSFTDVNVSFTPLLRGLPLAGPRM